MCRCLKQGFCKFYLNQSVLALGRYNNVNTDSHFLNKLLGPSVQHIIQLSTSILAPSNLEESYPHKNNLLLSYLIKKPDNIEY